MDFVKKTLGDLTIGKGQYGIGASAVDYSEDLYTYLRITDINDDGTLNVNNLKSINDKNAERYLLQPNDIVFARTGNSTGRNYFYDGTDGILVYAGFLIKFSIDSSKVNPKYIKYYCMSDEYKGWVQGHLTGSTRGNINAQTYANMEISIPPREQQNRIVSILEELERKRKNNIAINRNLLEQMQAIFGSIFYSEMEKGNKASLGDYLYIKGRIGWKGLKKEEYLSESEYRIINGESLTVTGIDWNKAGYISEERYIESPEIMLQEGDILISKDGTIGKIGYVNKLDKPTSVASGIFVVRNLKPEEVSTVFIYCLLNSDYFKSFIASRTEGSVIPHLYQKDFVTLEIPILSQEQIELFNSTVVPLFELFFSNQTENIRLAALRDSLLPKLMSGELDVSDLDI